MFGRSNRLSRYVPCPTAVSILCNGRVQSTPTPSRYDDPSVKERT